MKWCSYTAICIFCAFLLMGCNSLHIASINKSQRSEFHLYQKSLNSQFEAYECGRRSNSIEPVIDSLIRVMVCGPLDTVYWVESCNPPLFSYTAILWNHSAQYSIWSRSDVSTMISKQDHQLMELVMRWNRREIIETSKKKPLAHSGDWIQTNIVTRMIFRHGKCAESESIFFNEIDFDAKGPIWTIE